MASNPERPTWYKQDACPNGRLLETSSSSIPRVRQVRSPYGPACPSFRPQAAAALVSGGEREFGHWADLAVTLTLILPVDFLPGIGIVTCLW
jgi:hypothetical protein